MRASLLWQALARPATVGAIAPSSRFLSKALAEEAHGASLCIELGAGTGPVTAALLQAYPNTQLVAVELQPTLAKRLSARYPRARVVALPAAEVLRSYSNAPPNTVVVSSLPFRSLPVQVKGETVEALLHFLAQHECRWLVQFTYHPRPPFELPVGSGLVWTRTRTVWLNTPPAGVWVLQTADNR